MGIVPLVFKPGENLKTHGLTGFEKFDILGIGPGLKLRQELTVKATADDGKSDRVQSDLPHRHTGGVGLLPARRDFGIRVAAVAAELELSEVTKDSKFRSLKSETS